MFYFGTPIGVDTAEYGIWGRSPTSEPGIISHCNKRVQTDNAIAIVTIIIKI